MDDPIEKGVNNTNDNVALPGCTNKYVNGYFGDSPSANYMVNVFTRDFQKAGAKHKHSFPTL